MTTVADDSGSFGALLRVHRKAAGLSQKELAEVAGLSRRGISDLERGVRRRPPLGVACIPAGGRCVPTAFTNPVDSRAVHP
jgi:transcriptional regulator with XRE-family HTH domain